MLRGRFPIPDRGRRLVVGVVAITHAAISPKPFGLGPLEGRAVLDKCRGLACQTLPASDDGVAKEWVILDDPGRAPAGLGRDQGSSGTSKGVKDDRPAP